MNRGVNSGEFIDPLIIQPMSDTHTAKKASPPLLMLDADAMGELCKHLPLKLAFKLVCKATRDGHPDGTTTYVSDVVVSMPMLEWALKLGCPSGRCICRQAAAGGFLNVLTRVLADGVVPWDDTAFYLANRNGHLHVLRWIHARNMTIREGYGSLETALDRGHLRVAKWWVEVGRPYDYDDLVAAAASGCLETLQLLDANSTDCDDYMSVHGGSGIPVQEGAGRGGNLALLKWVLDSDKSKNDASFGIMDAAAEAGHLHVLQWMVSRYSFSAESMNSLFTQAAAVGNTVMMQWLLDRGCQPKDSCACEEAASRGQLQALQWMRGHDFPWDCLTCRSAARRGHLEVLQWARANGAPWDWSTLYSGAEHARNTGNAATFEWTLINHAPWDLPDYAKRVSDWPFFNDTIAWVDAHLNDELMQLQVKTLHHKTATLDVPTTARVGDALAAYAGKFGVRKDAIRYVHQGRQLESKRTLASYGICAGDTVHTVTHLSGEMASGNGGGCPPGGEPNPHFHD